VTGSNTGLGKHTAQVLADNGCQVVLACRSMEKADAAASQIRKKSGNDAVSVMTLDLTSFASIKKFVQVFKEKFNKLDYLINNAGLGSYEEGTTSEGFNMIIGVNFIGTALLTGLLLDTLSKDGRIVNVSSQAALSGLPYLKWGDQAKFIDDGAVAQLQSYSASKLMLSAWSYALADRLKKTDVCVFSLHPGTIATDIWRPLPEFVQWGIRKVLAPTDEGIAPILLCALDPSIKRQTGHFFQSNCLDADTEFTTYLATGSGDIITTVWQETINWCGDSFDFETCSKLH